MIQNNVYKRENNSLADLALVLAVGLLLGVVLSSILLYFLFIQKLSKNQVSCSTKLSTIEKIVREEIPVDISILANPMVQQWRGSVKGKLINKTDHTITLEDKNGEKITITDIAASGEIFKWLFLDTSKNNESKIITLSEIPIGTILRGEFWIFQDGKNVPLGGMFTIVNQEE